MAPDRLQRLRKAVALDLTPLRVSRDYRLLYIGRIVSYAGSMLTTVAFPYQVYQRTHSTLAVGLLGAVELVPLLIMALAGGAYADATTVGACSSRAKWASPAAASCSLRWRS